MPRHSDNKAEAGAKSPAFSSSDDPYRRTDPPAFCLTLRPHQSLTAEGFRWVLVFVGLGLAVPLLPVLGTPVGWGLLPFLVGVLVALDYAVRRNHRDREMKEELRLWPDLITVERTDPKRPVRRWHANPYWVTATLRTTRQIENYLTLKGNGREIELGAFLSPEQRVDLHRDLVAALNRIGRPA